MACVGTKFKTQKEALEEIESFMCPENYYTEFCEECEAWHVIQD